jgi:DnaJ-class molecular chaperone
MMQKTYYELLGVPEDASIETIKKAYKKLAMQHHPDRGGDTAFFQSLSQAYDVLSDENKRAQYDAERRGHPGFGPGGFDFGQFGDIGDIFGFTFGPGFANFRSQARPKNKDLTIQVQVSLQQSYIGAQLEAKYTLPTGKSQTVAVDIPAGIQSGQTIRYANLGDDSIPNIPRGNLNVRVVVAPDVNYIRQNNDLYTDLKLSLIDAMTGCTKTFTFLDGSQQSVTIKPGTQPGFEIKQPGKGFKDLQTGRVGNFVMVVKVHIPAITSSSAIEQLKETYAKLNITS